LCAHACFDPSSIYYSGVLFNSGERLDLAPLRTMGADGVNYRLVCGAAPGDGARIAVRQEIDTTVRFDSVTIESLWVDGNTLKAQVRYGGGCETHDFGLQTTGAIMESAPPQLSLVLSHDAHGDLCRAIVRDSLRFNLDSLAGLPGIGEQEVILNLSTVPGGAHVKRVSWAPLRMCSITYRGHYGTNTQVQLGYFVPPFQTALLLPRLVVTLDTTVVPTAPEKASAAGEELRWLAAKGVVVLTDQEIRTIVEKLSADGGQYWTLQDSVLSYNSWFVYDERTGSWTSGGAYSVNGVRGGCGAGVEYAPPPEPLDESNAAVRAVPHAALPAANSQVYDLRGRRAASHGQGVHLVQTNAGAVRRIVTIKVLQ
jgi:hypothetical protein